MSEDTATCTHLDVIEDGLTPSGNGCAECLASGEHWVHLRMCQECGHIGCCDSSPGKHATAHFHATGDPVIRSFEPGESWYWCFVDGIAFELADARQAPSHR